MTANHRPRTHHRPAEPVAQVQVAAVAPVTDQQGCGNVICIPAAPPCAENEAYAVRVREAFRTGRSPSDFPEEDYGAGWSNRFQPDELNEIGRRGLGLQPGLRPR